MQEIVLNQPTNNDRVLFAQKHGITVGDDVQIGSNVKFFGAKAFLGNGVMIGHSTKFVFDTLTIGSGVRFGDDCDIRSKKIHIDDGANIKTRFKALVADELSIGRNSFFGQDCEITCRKALIGEGLYAEHQIIMGGGGGVMGPFSELEIGRFVHIGEFSVLNPARRLTIGDYAGLGAHVMVYTHGMWPPALEGYPVTFGPVHIGSKSWLTGRCIVVPGVSIGDGVIVGMGSFVNKDLPAGCLAGGIPAKVLRENYYPRSLNETDRDRIVRETLDRYIPELEYKGFDLTVLDDENNLKISIDNNTLLFYSPQINDQSNTWLQQIQQRLIILTFDANLLSGKELVDSTTIFNLTDFSITGISDALSEDLRDFLRRNCIRFYTPDRFRSIIPPAFRWLQEV